DLTGDNIPDLLSTGGQNGIPAGLWQAQGQAGAGHGTGTGQVIPAAANVGVNGNGIPPGKTPGVFTGGQAITGHFNGGNLQDALVYYPTGYPDPTTGTTINAGAAVILDGNGDGSTLQPQDTFNTTFIPATAFQVSNTSPAQLANAGIAPDAPAGSVYPDLIGRTATGTGGYLSYYGVAFGGAGSYTL